MNIHTIIKPCNTAVLAFLNICIFAGASHAETHIVTQSGFSFSPSTLEISEGDTVQWNWTGGSHTVTNGTSVATGGNLFNDLLTSSNPTVTNMFDTAGTFPYFCSPHINFGMTGTITVVAAPVDNTPPVIIIVGDNPVTVFQNSVYTDDEATATDDVDGVITDDIVDFSNVNTATVGQYSVTYNVSDAAGNAADEKTRIVNVIANLDPSNIYVDGSHDGLEVGTDANPFKTVSSAIAVAENNAVINITVGSYTENFESSTLSPLMVTLQVNGNGTVTIGDDVIAALISGFRTRPIKEKSQDGEK